YSPRRSGCWNQLRGASVPSGYFSSRRRVTSLILASARAHSTRSGKSSLQFSHFVLSPNLIGHQKDSTLRSISAPSEYTPVIQSQYKHQMRSWPTRPLNFCRETFTQSDCL